MTEHIRQPNKVTKVGQATWCYAGCVKSMGTPEYILMDQYRKMKLKTPV